MVIVKRFLLELASGEHMEPSNNTERMCRWSEWQFGCSCGRMGLVDGLELMDILESKEEVRALQVRSDVQNASTASVHGRFVS